MNSEKKELLMVFIELLPILKTKPKMDFNKRIKYLRLYQEVMTKWSLKSTLFPDCLNIKQKFFASSLFFILNIL